MTETPKDKETQDKYEALSPRHRMLVDGVRRLKMERDTLTQRVKELETEIAEWKEQEHPIQRIQGVYLHEREEEIESLRAAGKRMREVLFKIVAGIVSPAPHEIAMKVKDLARYKEALEKINKLDPEKDSRNGIFDEWGEAECFNKAQEIAKAALAGIQGGGE